MTEPSYDDELKTYRLARAAFLLLAIALVPIAVHTVLTIFGQFGAPRILEWLNGTAGLDWMPTLTAWSILLGVTLLWGRWENASWRRRTSLLLALSLVDVGIWFLDLGDPRGVGDSFWFRAKVGAALGWAEVALLASLSGSFLTHLGVEQADESAKSTRSLAASGAMIWLIVFCETANLRDGWPIKPNPWVPRQTFLLAVGVELIWTICLIQVAALVVAAFRQADRQVRDLEAEPPEEELFAVRDAPRRRNESADDPDVRS